ncbi:hypothetical protein LMG23992_02577 [Cupriavidus laharis]|uniref:GNAT family N-acetyltransferase n=1 Tax=Cupriavidus laharis TaxID=151654 RepID=A0ABM8X230_9BURK|nr:hypothetical protein [Cupriavidus laharis]CAG9173922.1 hypothetical protein LMG23992_02577 [Cupriavidus laharis]
MPSHPAASHPSESFPQHQVRLGTSADAPRLDAWLQAAAPLPVPAARARRLVLEGLLAQSGQGVCLLAATSGGDIAACLPVALLPSLALGGLVACATEWWADAAAVPGVSDNRLEACLATLAEWCRAHGIRHILLAPGLADDTPPAGFARHANGLWHRNLAPAPKVLG